MPRDLDLADDLDEIPPLECEWCCEPLVNDDGEPRACACVRDAEAESWREFREGR